MLSCKMKGLITGMYEKRSDEYDEHALDLGCRSSKKKDLYLLLALRFDFDRMLFVIQFIVNHSERSNNNTF